MGVNVYVPGFWDRVEFAIGSTDLSKREITRKIGCSKCVLTPKGGNGYMMQSWTLAAFCKVTGVSADWLLGLSDEMWRNNGSGKEF